MAGLHVVGRRRAAARPRSTRAACSSSSSRAAERHAERRRGGPRAAAQAGRGRRACGSTSRTRRPSTSAGASPRACTSSRCRARTSTPCTTARRIAGAEAARDLPGLTDVTSDLRSRTRRSRSRSTATGRRRSASPPTRSRPRCTTPTARARSRPSTPPNNQYWVVMELLPEYQRDLLRSRPALRPLGRRRSRCRSRRWRMSATEVGPLTRQPFRPAALGDALVQPGARRLAGRRGDRGAARGRRDPARHDHHGVRRHRAGVPGRPAAACWACCCRSRSW